MSSDSVNTPSCGCQVAWYHKSQQPPTIVRGISEDNTLLVGGSVNDHELGEVRNFGPPLEICSGTGSYFDKFALQGS